jgi:outer membrane protein, heavy metal efflux system
MAFRKSVCLMGTSAFVVILAAGCTTSPFDTADSSSRTPTTKLILPSDQTVRSSVYRVQEEQDQSHASELELDSTPASYVEYALFNSPEIERAYQQWRAASQRLPQVKALPDPRLNIGFFLNEVETRVGPQQAKVGVQQTFPWIGKLQDREDAAAKGALAAWYTYQDAQLRVAERVMISLHNLSYLDEAIRITQENLSLLESFEEVVRARYRVGAGSHPELIRVQVEMGQLEDRVLGLEAMRPPYVASLNAALNRASGIPVPAMIDLPNAVASDNADEIAELAFEWSPVLQSINQRIEQARIQTEVARKDGYPDLTIGFDYVITDEARNPSTPESGDDPLMISFGMNLPIWREKYDAKVLEAISKRLSVASEFDSRTNQISAQVYQAWFEHTDADRRVRLYEQSLIPKAQESLSASLIGFRTGDTEFLDLLDTERKLLEFSISAERARAERGKALATLNRLVGRAVPTSNVNPHTHQSDLNTEEVQP